MDVKWVAHIYHRVKTWLTALAIVAPLALHYGPVPREWEARALPLAIACAFGITVEMLVSIERKLDAKLAYKRYEHVADCIPDIIDLVAQPSRKGPHVVKVLASTGGTTVNVLLPRIINAVRATHCTIDFRICLVNPASPLSSLMPTHWVDEARVSVKRLMDEAAAELKLTCSQYDYVPCLRGILIDDSHLFLGFFSWSDGNKDFISGSAQPHFYLRRDVQNDYVFRLWEGWFDYAPSERIFPQAQDTG
jgi:hypothetical protein